MSTQRNADSVIHQAIEDGIVSCSIAFSDFGASDKTLIAMKVEVFKKVLTRAGLGAKDIQAGFSEWIENGEPRFPAPSDIVKMFQPVTLYQMDNGPSGFGATYHGNHPYVRQQVRLGLDISRYAVTVRAADATKAKLEAENAPPLEWGEDSEPDIEPRRGSGWQRIGYEH